MKYFGMRLNEVVKTLGPLCVGIEPSRETLVKWGLADDVSGVDEFCDRMIEASGGRVGIVKPQSAYFERLGWRGQKALERVCRLARQNGIIVILDAKRGDIGRANEAYAQAYLEIDSPIAVDAITVSPYLGFCSLSPLIDIALDNGNGIFVLARTSNPEGALVQDAYAPDGMDLTTHVIHEAALVNNAARQKHASVGIVFGATIPTTGYDLASFTGPILVPGIGAPGIGTEGATVSDVKANFREAAGPVIPTVSGQVTASGPGREELRSSIERLAGSFRTAN